MESTFKPLTTTLIPVKDYQGMYNLLIVEGDGNKDGDRKINVHFNKEIIEYGSSWVKGTKGFDKAAPFIEQYGLSEMINEAVNRLRKLI
ncbi:MULTISPECIES: hypothetical protein [Pseudoalteromonas]|uniref:Uncharacterized protein n=1 Tax=Pseudoalteromonas luteoviolacea (strain 2ta16) TaxID=1353533 RepID=V4HMI4_PSEL2|nr:MULTISPECIES: hypothetical protein [Pseudoalteromonas]ESP90963.1 hypothetical protein PL2TA16_01354 [Pseudoalteromonas luteoviolacea 2ta16]KZN38280.1 hypothetical protein N483_20205 [Pseudoalteromonas luteoviolacea NCIMB 1944]MCG7547711.1 hypothetical protein [Pseudoalteromonas sp. Of7M-16]